MSNNMKPSMIVCKEMFYNFDFVNVINNHFFDTVLLYIVIDKPFGYIYNMNVRHKIKGGTAWRKLKRL